MKSGSLLFATVISLFFLVGLVGCQKRVITQPDSGKQTQQEQKEQKDTGKDLKDREKVIDKKLDGKIESSDTNDMNSRYAPSKDASFSDILFDYDKYEVKDSYKQNLMAMSAWMTKNSTARLSIEGHCDERGTNEYNLALGDRRAKAVKDYLISLGVSSGRIDVISYGEEKPLCNEMNEDCWSKNRRAHVTALVKVGK